MKKEFVARRLDVKSFAEAQGQLAGHDTLGAYPRLMAETAGRGASLPVTWRGRGELRNPRHVQPQMWLHLQAEAVLPLTCQRCLEPVDIAVAFERSFRFVADEETAAAEDDASEEDLLALSPAFDLIDLIEDELLMELPVAPRHPICPQPVKMAVADPGFEAGPGPGDNPFSQLEKIKTGRNQG